MRHNVLIALLATLPVKAFAFDWKACDKDIKKFCTAAKGDEAIFQCLEKVESKLTKPCNQAHEKYEKESGKEEKEDKDEVKETK